jgi:Flp pilus assembly protein TadG
LRRHQRHETGAAGVEFALVFPVFLLVVFGAVELGTALYDRAILTNASREAARAGVMLQTTPMSTTSIGNIAKTYVQNNLIDFTGATPVPVVTVTQPDGSTLTGSRLQVQVSYTFNGLIFGPLLAPFTGPMAINTVTVMKYE